jgi:hypothetical protein
MAKRSVRTIWTKERRNKLGRYLRDEIERWYVFVLARRSGGQ